MDEKKRISSCRSRCPCPNACEMWKANEDRKQAVRNRGKAIVNSSTPTYDQELLMVVEDDEMSKEKEIDKLMALISLSFKKIYKPTNNNLRTSSNTSRADLDNTPRIKKGIGYDNQRLDNVARARENVARECQKPKQAKDAAYHKEKMLLCKQEEAGIQLSVEQADWRDDTDDEPDDQELEANLYLHGTRFKWSANDMYLEEQGDTNITIDSLDMITNRKTVDQDDNDFARERMYKVHTKPNQTRTPQLPQDIRKTNKHVSFSTRVIPTTSVSRPQLKSNRLEDRVMHNDSHGKKQQVEDHRNASRTANFLEPMTPKCSKHITGNLKLLSNFVKKFLGMVKFGNDQIALVLGYGDLVQGTITIKRVYYVEDLNHNLFSVGQFCDAELEVAFRKSTCYVRDLKGNDLLTSSRGTDLYSITLQDTSTPNPIFLMAKATSSQAWLWHRRLSHLNFDSINLLSKNDIVIGLLKLKFVK
ncbi:retrovirus-related pol polyprotein from transposon TNT 1-94, partial [Tanacetum coccineum]